MVGGVVGGAVVVGVAGGWMVVGGWTVGGRVDGVIVLGPPPALGLKVVVVASRPAVVVLAGRPTELPRNAPVPGDSVPAVAAERLGPVAEGTRDLLAVIVGAGENPIPKASQPRPQRPWAARAKATAKATQRGGRDPGHPDPAPNP